NIEHLRGSDHNDTLTGDEESNRLIGGAGEDTLDGGAGKDWAFYHGSDAAVVVNLSVKNDSGVTTGVGGHAADDKLSNIEHLHGSDHDDTLTGDGESNRLFGGAGNDTLNGGAGHDVLLIRP
ncbi:MAG: hypothetical protein GDA36_14215, partial [Rhodobacteraceae bacterium]|nr:hypothetical protein [Paracoccaceae bacterium]